MNITKEQALEIAKFNDNTIHCFIHAPMGLVGANHTIDSFMKELDEAESIEIGVNICRKMEHALVLWIKGVPFFFEPDEGKLKRMMKIIDLAEKQRNSEILPKHIRYADEDLYFDGVSYYDKEGNNSLIDILAMNYQALTHLYDEVEILEEEKKIPEKLFGEPRHIYNENELYIVGKINEIIDYLKSKGE